MTADDEREDEWRDAPEDRRDRREEVEPAAARATLVHPEVPRPPLRRALDALEDLVEESVRSGKRTRFAEASRICKVGQELLRATAEGVADHADGDLNDGNFNVNVGPCQAVRGVAMNVRDDAHQNAIDQLGALRELFEPLKAQAAAAATRDGTRAGADRADEIVSLQSALKHALPGHVDAIRARLDALIAEMDNGKQAAVKPRRSKIKNATGEARPDEEPEPKRTRLTRRRRLRYTQRESAVATRSSTPRYFTIATAAPLLDTDENALRARCRREASRSGRDRVELGGGVVAYKFGATWRIEFPKQVTTVRRS